MVIPSVMEVFHERKHEVMVRGDDNRVQTLQKAQGYVIRRRVAWVARQLQ
jgi:hypothetical protein